MKKLFVIGALTVVLAVAACSSDSKSNTSTSNSSGSKTSSSAPASSAAFDEATAKAQITTAFQTLLDGTKDLETKLSQMEDPEKIRAIFEATAAQNGDSLKQA